MMLPSTTARVAENTAAEINAQIRRQAEERVAWHALHPERIPARLGELDREWDIERAIQANAASLAFAGLMLGLGRDRRWLVLPVAVTAFLLQHALQGWCPPVPVLRRMGFRTASEIDAERVALKALRGDFAEVVPGPQGAARAMAAARE
jgi:hypothetical protein